MIKYKAVSHLWKIEPTEIIKETEKTIFLRGGRKERKVSEWGSWHDTWEDARQALLSRAEGDVASARLRLQGANGKLGNIKGMKNPEEER